MDKTNTQFYTDRVALAELDSAVLASCVKGFSSPIGWYITQLDEHLAAVKKVVNENVQARDLRVSWNQTTSKAKIVGTVPWSNERIQEFENAMKNEKSEIDQLRLLIAKHPGKALDAIGYMLESQKSKEPAARPTAEFETVEE